MEPLTTRFRDVVEHDRFIDGTKDVVEVRSGLVWGLGQGAGWVDAHRAGLFSKSSMHSSNNLAVAEHAPNIYAQRALMRPWTICLDLHHCAQTGQLAPKRQRSCPQAELARKKAASQPASQAVWCLGIKYDDPKYFYIMGMAGAGVTRFQSLLTNRVLHSRDKALCRRAADSLFRQRLRRYLMQSL